MKMPDVSIQKVLTGRYHKLFHVTVIVKFRSLTCWLPFTVACVTMVSLAMEQPVSTALAPTTFVLITSSAFRLQPLTVNAKRDLLVMTLVPVSMKTNVWTTKPIATKMQIVWIRREASSVVVNKDTLVTASHACMASVSIQIAHKIWPVFLRPHQTAIAKVGSQLILNWKTALILMNVKSITSARQHLIASTL